jgi:hypothetical protein
MPTTRQYRAKAAKYNELAEAASSADIVREFHKREQNLTRLADNEQWMIDNHEKTVHHDKAFPVPGQSGFDKAPLSTEEEHILRCLGAALIMQWNTLPTDLQKKLFDSAGTMGDLLDTSALRGQVARFLHKHKDDEDLARSS